MYKDRSALQLRSSAKCNSSCVACKHPLQNEVTLGNKGVISSLALDHSPQNTKVTVGNVCSIGYFQTLCQFAAMPKCLKLSPAPRIAPPVAVRQESLRENTQNSTHRRGQACTAGNVHLAPWEMLHVNSPDQQPWEVRVHTSTVSLKQLWSLRHIASTCPCSTADVKHMQPVVCTS